MENYIVNIIWKILLAYYIYLSKLFIVLCSCELCEMLILNKSDATGHRWGDIISLHSGRSPMLSLAWLTAPTIGHGELQKRGQKGQGPQILNSNIQSSLPKQGMYYPSDNLQFYGGKLRSSLPTLYLFSTSNVNHQA